MQHPDQYGGWAPAQDHRRIMRSGASSYAVDGIDYQVDSGVTYLNPFSAGLSGRRNQGLCTTPPASNKTKPFVKH